MEDMEKVTINRLIEWLKKHGHTSDEITECIEYITEDKKERITPTRKRRKSYREYKGRDLSILSKREREAMEYKIAGLSNQVISDKMGVSAGCICTFIHNATCKLDGTGTYTQNHKEKINAAQREYRKNWTSKQSDKQREYQKKYQVEHAQQLQKYNREYYLKNREKILQKNKHKKGQRKEKNKMKWLVKYDSEIIGSVTTNHSMTDEEICETAGIDLARTQEDYEGAPENGKYILENLEIVEEPQ